MRATADRVVLISIYGVLMTTKFWTEAQITILSVPTFREPAHLPVQWMAPTTPLEKLIEFAGRLCYMSQSNPADRTTTDYIDNIRKQAHGSVLEHANISVLFEGVSRTFTHELVRHRAGFAYSQLSQRYVDESEVGFVVPPAVQALDDEDAQVAWKQFAEASKAIYVTQSDALFRALESITNKVLRRKAAREAARSVLLNAAETKIVATANVRAWRQTMELRTGLGAEEEIRRAFLKLLPMLQEEAPSCFNDFTLHFDNASGKWYATAGYHKV